MTYDLKVDGLVGASTEDVLHARTDRDVLRRLNDHPISRVSGDLQVEASQNRPLFLGEQRNQPGKCVRAVVV